jgi:hypothetical protein
MADDTTRGILRKREANIKRLEKEAPNLYQGFNELMKYCYKPGIPCVAFHVDNAIKAGATKNEILEAATIGVEVGGGPSFVIVRDNLLDFLDDIGVGDKG